MTQAKLAFPFVLLLSGAVCGQKQEVNQPEELDIAEIELKAEADAKADFGMSRKLVWGAGSVVSGYLSFWITISMLEDLPLVVDHPLILVPMGSALALGPPIASKIIGVDLPKKRQMELADNSEPSRLIYQAKYISEIRHHRFTYSLASPVAFVVTGLGLFVYLFLFGWGN